MRTPIGRPFFVTCGLERLYEHLPQMKSLHWEESSGAKVTVSYYSPKRSLVGICLSQYHKMQEYFCQTVSFEPKSTTNTIVVDLELPSVCSSVLANGINKINVTYNKMSEMST